MLPALEINTQLFQGLDLRPPLRTQLSRRLLHQRRKLTHPLFFRPPKGRYFLRERISRCGVGAGRGCAGGPGRRAHGPVVQEVDVLRISRPAQQMELPHPATTAAAVRQLPGEQLALPGLHLVGRGQGQAAGEEARDDAGLELGEREGDDALGQGDEAQRGRGAVEDVPVEVLDSHARVFAVGGEQGRVEGGEEGEGIQIAGAEDDGLDVLLDMPVCEVDLAALGVEARDFGEGSGREGGCGREGLRGG
jgi:hypothetical protein